jgi:hypothetical protein
MAIAEPSAGLGSAAIQPRLTGPGAVGADLALHPRQRPDRRAPPDPSARFKTGAALWPAEASAPAPDARRRLGLARLFAERSGPRGAGGHGRSERCEQAEAGRPRVPHRWHPGAGSPILLYQHTGSAV